MKLENYLNILEKSKLFGIHNEVDFIKIFNSIDYKIIKYSKGRVVHDEDDLCTCLSIILQGSIEIQKIDAMGKLLTVAEFTIGSTFGENLIFGDKKRYPMTVFSKTDTIVLEIKKESVTTLCQLDPKFMLEFLNTVSNRAMVLNSKLIEVALKTIRQKICEFLLLQYNKNQSTQINIGMTKKDWADKLGVQRPSLSRELIKMKEDGIIEYDKYIIIIKDVSGLE